MSRRKSHSKYLALSFIRASEGDLESNILKKTTQPHVNLDGNDVREFYEQVISKKSEVKSESQSARASCSKQSEVTPSEREPEGKPLQVNQRHKNQFLRAAQDGNVKELMRLFSGGVDLNCVDGYGWTALMCAVKAEEEEAVQCLVSVGADPYVRDKQGLSVFDLLDSCKNEAIMDLFCAESETSDGEELQESFHCSLCKATFSETEESHCKGTLHRFNRGKPPKGTVYGIPENNKGFQMMLRSGWDRERGLGHDGKGKQFPVATVLKRDRKGLGKDKKIKAKVTHFGPNDDKAVQYKIYRTMKEKTMKKHDRLKQLSTQKRKDMKFRMEFHMDDTQNY